MVEGVFCLKLFLKQIKQNFAIRIIQGYKKLKYMYSNVQYDKKYDVIRNYLIKI